MPAPTPFILDQMVAARLRRRLLTVVDTLGFDDERRLRHLALARERGPPGDPGRLRRARSSWPASATGNEPARSRPPSSPLRSARLRQIRGRPGGRGLGSADCRRRGGDQVRSGHREPGGVDCSTGSSAPQDADVPSSRPLQGCRGSARCASYRWPRRPRGRALSGSP